MAGWSLHRADTVCSACHSSELNSVKHGGILLEYGIDFWEIISISFENTSLHLKTKYIALNKKPSETAAML